MSAAQVDPHDKMRARDVNKVARGEQAPRPAHEYGTVSPPPPPSSTHTIDDTKNKNKGEKSGIAENGAELTESNDYKTCYVKYVEYHRCVQQKGEKAPECQKLGTYFRSFCPTEWITEWDKEREEGN
ncbi:putative cytochrome c oxidase subunit 6b-like [Vigna unguiculata]|uniref:Cytochrome c oxidase subunit VIb n=1 Tax=Vigna unguiculata TaxID=3917 RepID=A0A4D6LSG6_VIGUN|nr:putative cytochrome c oxidase subunit 6b-like [Vigna unguiculata]QCD91485.1 cytochrome c oxidase subunit VIb [Vigna unguiculata]